MLADQLGVTAQLDVPPRTPRRSRREHSRRRRAGRALAFAGAAGLILLYALRGGGSYDSVVFAENGLVIWWILALGVGLGLLPRARPPRIAVVFLAALAAYVAWTALSLTWTASSELTTQEVARALDYLGLATLIVFVLDRDTWRPAAAGLGFGAMIVCLVAVGSRLAPSVFGTDQIDVTFHIDRLSYPFGYWNSVAGWGAMCTALGLAWSAHDTVRARRAMALALVPIAGLTTYLTYSRAGVGGVALAVIAVLALTRNRLTALVHTLAAAGGTALAIVAVRGEPQIAHAAGNRGAGSVWLALSVGCILCAGVALATRRLRLDSWRLPRRAARILAIAGGVVALTAAGALGPRLASRAWQSFTRTQPAQTSSDPTARLSSLSGSRYPLWKSAISAFDAHPLDGTGAGTIELWWNQHGTDGEFVRDAHNIWLENMAELGAPGLILIVTVFAAGLALGLTVRRRARRSASAGAAAALTAVLVVYLLHASFDWMWESTATTVLALGGVAILAARVCEGRTAMRLPARGTLAAVALIAAIVQVPGLLSTAAIRRSQQAERAGRQSEALSWAGDAVEAEPWSASAYEQRGLVLESEGRLQDAAADLGRAISREPTNYIHWLLRSRVETELGQLPAAVSDYQHARRLRPLGSVFVLAPYFTGG